MRSLIVIIPILWAGCQTISSTSSVDEKEDNPVLFTVGDSTVHAEEFVYVYNKNNERLDSAFTQNDVADYLKLYEDFKVKIMEAYARGYDTLKEYKDELSTYTEQLKEPYLTETKITDDLIQEAYERTLEEIRASHILIRFPSNPTPEDTLDAYGKIRKIYELALEGHSFDSLAIRFSEDPSAKTNRGDLGYFTSMQMVYPFESAAYSTMENQISPIVRTRFGYHIIKVRDRRPANGTVVVSHIMLRQKPDSAAVRNRIFEIHEMATGGMPWNQLVNKYSEDMNSKEKGGKINPFGVGQAPLDFQEAAFALTKPGEISDPVNTRYGWHILRLEERRPLPKLDAVEPSIKRRITQDERARLGRDELVNRLKSEWGFEEEFNARKFAIDISDSSLQSANWSVPDSLPDQTLFKIGSSELKIKDFALYMAANQRQNNMDPRMYASQMYDEFLAQSVIDWEEAHLEEKYPEYRMLLREYREGILYFQLMEEEIWNRASEDSLGQRRFYEMHPELYPGKRTAQGIVYSMPDSLSARRLENRLNEGRDPDAFLKTLGSADNQILPLEVEWGKGEDSPWKDIPQEIGIYCKNIMGNWYVVDVQSVNENSVSEFEKIRGKVISDYQQYLEKEWVRQLRDKYPVKRNEQGVSYVFKTLVK